MDCVVFGQQESERGNLLSPFTLSSGKVNTSLQERLSFKAHAQKWQLVVNESHEDSGNGISRPSLGDAVAWKNFSLFSIIFVRIRYVSTRWILPPFYSLSSGDFRLGGRHNANKENSISNDLRRCVLVTYSADYNLTSDERASSNDAVSGCSMSCISQQLQESKNGRLLSISQHHHAHIAWPITCRVLYIVYIER